MIVDMDDKRCILHVEHIKKKQGESIIKLDTNIDETVVRTVRC